MRTFVLLSLLGLAASGPSKVEQGECLVNSGEAISDATDAALFIWAASKRCGVAGKVVKCEVDITSAVKSVNSMINVILKAVDKCDGLKTANKACGFAAGSLTEHTSALAAAAGMVAQKCPAVAAASAPALGALAAPVMCTIDLKNTAKHLFKAIKVLTKTKDKCKHGTSKKCAVNALDIVGSFAGMGGWLAGAMGHCKRTTAVAGDAAATADTRKSLCVQATGALLEQTMKVAQDGIQLSEKCHSGGGGGGGGDHLDEATSRLFEQEGEMDGGNTPIMNLVLGAFLPVTAVVGFVGGRFYANHRSRVQQSRQFMPDVDEAEI